MSNIKRLLIVNIKLLNGIREEDIRWAAGKEMSEWNCIEDAYLLAELRMPPPRFAISS